MTQFAAMHQTPSDVRRLQRGGDEEPDVDEVREVVEAKELPELVGRVGGQGHIVPARDLEQRLGLHRALEVDVELDLRKRLLRRTHARRSVETAA